MLERFHEARRRHRTRGEGDPEWFERVWRQGLRGIPRPEAVPIPGDGHEARNARLANGIVDLPALGVRAAEVPATKSCITGSGPRWGERLRHVLRVGAPIERARRTAPHLPCGIRAPKRTEEPG